jgi:hypothetical protein
MRVFFVYKIPPNEAKILIGLQKFLPSEFSLKHQVDLENKRHLEICAKIS